MNLSFLGGLDTLTLNELNGKRSELFIETLRYINYFCIIGHSERVYYVWIIRNVGNTNKCSAFVNSIWQDKLCVSIDEHYNIFDVSTPRVYRSEWNPNEAGREHSF